MDTQALIRELKSLGLDPAQLDIEKMQEDRIAGLLEQLALRRGDAAAQDYLRAMADAANRAEAPNFNPEPIGEN